VRLQEAIRLTVDQRLARCGHSQTNLSVQTIVGERTVHISECGAAWNVVMLRRVSKASS
jgi:hypothetical protein